MHRLKLTARLACLAVFFGFIASCKSETSPAPAAPEKESGLANPVVPAAEPAKAVASAWDLFVDRYIEDFLAAHPAFAVYQGRHEFDGMLPDWSSVGIAREIMRLKLAREDALAFSDEELGEDGRYQREYLVAAIDRALFWLDTAEWPFVNPAFYFDWMSDTLDPSPDPLEPAHADGPYTAAIRYRFIWRHGGLFQK
jgi:hypothetical protein